MTLINSLVSLEAFDKALKVIDKRMKKLVENQQKEKLIIYKEKENEVNSLKTNFYQKLEKLEIFKNMENSQMLKLYDMLTKKGIKVKKQVHNIPSHCHANIYTNEDGMFHFPILIIYEEFNMTDYIQDVDENILVSDILDMLMAERLPWDKENKYNPNTAACFYEISDQNHVLKTEVNYYYPLRNDDRLIDILTNKKVYMNGFPVICIISQINNFYSHFKQNKIILKRK
jgi:hypothetical protein